MAVIEAANLAYLEAYRRNARLMALLEQVATVDEGFRELRGSAQSWPATRGPCGGCSGPGWPIRSWIPT